MIIHEQVQLRNYVSPVALSLSRPQTKPSELFSRKPFLFRNELRTLSWYNLASHICLLSGTGYLVLQLLSGTGCKFICLCLQHVTNPSLSSQFKGVPPPPPPPPSVTEQRLPIESLLKPTMAFARLAYICLKCVSSSQHAKQLSF